MEKQVSNLIVVEFICSNSDGNIESKDLLLKQGTLMSNALAHCPFETSGRGISIFGKKVPKNYVLRDKDRIEICRPLIFDPMISRKRRADIAKMGILKKEAQKRRKVKFDSN
ncbi:RnfH family protein [Taylorella equigenitalis]|nr:RnfH family protein [Taylorella equigenitalis]